MNSFFDDLKKIKKQMNQTSTKTDINNDNKNKNIGSKCIKNDCKEQKMLNEFIEYMDKFN